ncbi:hypothetical protein H4R27_002236 [Coemansia aciculifera]|nr:hypothetical protein H4R27_002236 [Coemansia aciculifera]
MTDILSKTMFIAGMVASAARSTASYYIRGPRCAKWSLVFQIRRDVMHKAMSSNLKRSPTDAEIEQIDFGLIAKHNEKWDLPTSEVPANMGAFRAASIRVADIDVDPELFAGAGPAESGLRLLVAQDLQETGREIPYEFTAPISMLGEGCDLERVFKCTPIDESENIVLYVHGGGYRYGSPASHRSLTGRLSGLSGLRCMSVHYRLAPLHPYPAQLHDAFLAFVYLLKQGFKPQNIVLAGDSAGGNLALSLLLLLRHTGITRTVCGLVLLSPWTDLVSSRSSLERNAKYDYLTGPPLLSPLAPARVFYAPGRRYSQALFDEMSHPLVSPVNGDFKDFPPTLIQAGDKEVLADDIAQLYENLLRDNPDRQDSFIYECYADMIHVFHQFMELDDAAVAYASAGKFMKGL